MKTIITFMFCLCISVQIYTQNSLETKRNLRFPAWITHSNNSDIIGLSLAAFPKGVLKKDTTLTRTYGIRFEVSLLAVLSPLMPTSPVSRSLVTFDAKQASGLSEIVNGINLSSGTFGETKVNGLSSSLYMQYLYKMNGFTIAGMSNFVEKHNGIAIAALGNDIFNSNGINIGFGNYVHYFNGIQIGGFNTVVEKGFGLQIGIFNDAKSFRGLQIGLWNKNEKRSLPFINWNFKS